MQPLGRPLSWAVAGRTGPARLQLAARQFLRAAPMRLSSSQLPRGSKEPSGGHEPLTERNGGEGLNPRLTAGPGKSSPSSQASLQPGVKERFSQLMDRLQSRALDASHTLNDLTGYSGIEAIKAENTALEISLAEAHERLRTARQSYKSSNAKRAATQREVTTLLARKESWTPTDLERFTELYRTDHVLEGEVSSAQESLTEAEAEEQRLSQRLNAGILKRYHEEQIWSDRIRRASTWGTWGLMGMNFILFVVLQFVAEPWKRKRLVNGVVAEEKEVLEKVRSEITAVKAALEEAKKDSERADAEAAAGEAAARSSARVVAEGTTHAGAIPVVTWMEFLKEPAQWKAAAEDLYSERRLDLRMRDVSALAIEGAAAGAALAGSVAWMIARKS